LVSEVSLITYGNATITNFAGSSQSISPHKRRASMPLSTLLWRLSNKRNESVRHRSFIIQVHHRFQDEILNPEYEKFPELAKGSLVKARARRHKRNTRRDEELSIANFVVSNSHFTTQSLMKAGVSEGKILTVPLGCEVAVPSMDQQKRTRLRILYAGELSLAKGIHYLLDAIRKLQGFDFELRLVGSVRLPSKCFQNLPQVHVDRRIPQSQLFQLMSQSDVFIFPTLCDGFGLVVAEALAHGLPVVATANCGAADLIQNDVNGWVIPAADSNAIENRIAFCLQHPHQLREMRQNCIQSASARTWKDYRVDLQQQCSKASQILNSLKQTKSK
jgi:glycosyltransferase involved in cell wall biosynthesis